MRMGVKRRSEPTSADTDVDTTIITEDETELYDRQIRLWGYESQKRLRESEILIIGMNGLGAEIAKNIALAGVKSITILDDKEVSEKDYSAQFLLGRAEVGKNRSEASRNNLLQLNQNVVITSDSSCPTEKNDDFFASFNAIIAIDCSLEFLTRLNKICRENSVKFFCTDTWGMYGFCFTDFASYSFGVVHENDSRSSAGEPFSKVKKTEHVADYCPLEKALKLGKVGVAKRISKIFFLTHVLLKFREDHGRYPSPEYKTEDIESLKIIRKSVMADLGFDETKLEDDTFNNVFGELSPVCSVLGGAVGQEIIRAICGDKAVLENFFLFNGEDCSGLVEAIGTN